MYWVNSKFQNLNAKYINWPKNSLYVLFGIKYYFKYGRELWPIYIKNFWTLFWHSLGYPIEFRKFLSILD